MMNTFNTSFCRKKVEDLNLIFAHFSKLHTADYYFYYNYHYYVPRCIAHR